jgi:ferrochelatase
MAGNGRKIGVLVMSYGTPQSMDRIEAYYTHIRHGRKPTPEQLQNLTERYETVVGGVFPLRENTNKQVSGLQDELRRRTGDAGTVDSEGGSDGTQDSGSRAIGDAEFACYQGMKHAAPFIEDGVRQMAQDGIREAVGIVLAPHYSHMSVGDYMKRAEETAAEAGVQMCFVREYHLHPKLIAALVDRVKAALGKFTESERAGVKVIFTAHSLPERILQTGDPYVDQLMATSKAVAGRCELASWQFGWQSAGRTPEPWLGPDILDVLRTIRQDENVRSVLICPIGFVSDHLEVLYDIDVEAKKLAAELGMHLERTESLNTDPLYMETLAESVLQEASKLV